MHLQRLFIVIFVLLLAAIVYIPLLGRTLTYDKAFTFNQYANRGLGVSLIGYTAPNNHIFHTTLVWLSTTLIGRSEIAIRLPAFFAALLSLALSFRIAVRQTNSISTGLLAAAILAAQPGFLTYSVAARGYTLTILLSLVTFVLLLESNLTPRVKNYGLMLACMGLIMTMPTMVIGIGALFLMNHHKIPIAIGTFAGAMFYMPAIAIGVFSDQAAQNGLDLKHFIKEGFGLWADSFAVLFLVAGIIIFALSQKSIRNQQPILRFTLLAITLAIIGITLQLIISGRTLFPRNLLFLLSGLTILAALGFQRLPISLRVVATFALLAIMTLYISSLIDDPDPADALDYFEAQPANSTTVFGCCVNEVVTYYHGDDERLQLHPDVPTISVMFNPNYDNVEKVLADYEVDELVKDCEYSQNFRHLAIYQCVLQPSKQ